MSDFLATHPDEVLTALESVRSTGMRQLDAWRRTDVILRAALNGLPKTTRCWGMALEYTPPRSGGKGPDIVLLTHRSALIIEAKDVERASSAAVEQCRAYVRDLQEYHAASRRLKVEGAVLVTRSSTDMKGDIPRLSATGLRTWLAREETCTDRETLSKWLSSPFTPAPALVDRAKELFSQTELPVGPAHANGETERSIRRLVEDTQSHRLVLLTGVPGSGKTYLGLRLVHGRRDAAFLSGNGPLVETLQFALQSKASVQDVHAFVRDCVRDIPVEESVVVFDEAQRAWDEQRMRKKQDTAASEAEVILKALAKRPKATLLALIGEGQEIHVGEEAGMAPWVKAVQESGNTWTVFGPPHLAEPFGTSYQILPELALTESRRAHAAAGQSAWVEALLAGDGKAAQRLAADFKHAFFLRWTPDFSAAKEFLNTRYADDPAATYGLLASSKASNLKNYGLDVGMMSRQVVRVNYKQVGPWFCGSPPGCRALSTAATEFICQGLELDAALLAWGYDLTWTGDSWHVRGQKREATDWRTLRFNSYRVLLTRARDGIVVYLPDGAEMLQTASFLEECGFERLDS